MSEAAMLWRQYRLERRMFWRNPSAAFFNFLLPLLFLAFFGALFRGNKHDIDVLLPGIAGMSVMATTFTALAFNMTFLREQGILKRMRGTPLPSRTYLGGIALNALTNTVVQIVVVVLAGKAIFGIGWPQNLGELIVFVFLGVLCFSSLGVALAHAIPNFESAPVYVNVVFLPLIFISGVFYDVQKVPGFLRDIAQALPLKHLIDGLEGGMVTGSGIGSHWTAILVLLLWTAVGVFLAVRGFSWEQRRH
jgi:ABC-2 type transport system permease protein